MKKWSEMVASGKRFTKKQLLAHLPDWALTPVKKRHYLGVLKTISTDYDPDFMVLKHLVSAGDFVIDLGAHVGACTKIQTSPAPGNFAHGFTKRTIRFDSYWKDRTIKSFGLRTES